MMSTTSKWFRRNRTKFAVGFGVVGAGYVATQYVLGKITEARERMSVDRIARENLRRRFEQNQEDCTFTVLALLPTATENILESLQVESITHELQQHRAARLARGAEASEVAPSDLSSVAPGTMDDEKKSVQSFASESYVDAGQAETSTTSTPVEGSQPEQEQRQRPRKSKLQLWNELKINSITRSFTLIYALSLLTLLTRIQLNLLGRRSYLSSVVSLAIHNPNESTISLENHDTESMEKAYGNDFETNRKYLTFSWWLLHRGWKAVMAKVQTAVAESFGPLNPRDDLTLAKVSELTLEVRKKIEGATEEDRRANKWLEFLLPPRSEEEFVLRESGMDAEAPPQAPSSSVPDSSMTLRRLLDETADLIDSPTFTHVLTLLLDCGFSNLVDQKLSTQAFKLPGSSAPGSGIEEIIPEDVKAKLPTILACFSRQAHSIGNGVPNEYLQSMESIRELEAFAAVIYSSNFEFEAHSDDAGGSSKEKNAEGGSVSGKGMETNPTVEEDTVTSNQEKSFESAWDRAVEKAEVEKQ